MISRVRINPLECYDRVKSCSKEAKNGFCASNYHYMIDRCPWSCRFCRRARGDTDKCEDIDQRCPEWVSKNECATRPDYMAQNCKKSCEMCGPESEYKVSDSETHLSNLGQSWLVPEKFRPA
ncbi:putative tyrosinase-like protein tyr-3 [Stylophora pistillata]|uniref:putative tyrosinase-like protein tyr-3 n=1 Tax=Stylophora pistillata TaxID=50429 RepID=UPI000C03EB3D|nr:putative tyrosinase-like protein tyr-3 [Stylophora pistillata]